MRFYNTLSRRLEDFQAIRPPKVSLYTCGPTVYDRLHLGNWVAYIRWDTLARLLELHHFQVQRVMNITDVGHLISDADEGQDKLEKSAQKEGRSAWEIAQSYTEDFKSGLKSLNLLEPQVYAKATEHIGQQIDLIQKLETKGYVYRIDDGLYFDTSKFPTYADFARLDLEHEQAGSRIGVNHQKRQAADFALWKFSPKDRKRDMEWDSPWGKGFPGWHLECSAMAMQYLGETIDIHTGGIDHIPIHHTNEIAQSEAATGKRFANYWLHNNFLLVEGTKISKSLGNGHTLEELIAKGYDPLDFKMFVLQSHYRSESNFSWQNLAAAKSRLNDLRALADLRWQLPAQSTVSQPKLKLDEVRQKMLRTLDDDMNTPLALSQLSEVVKLAPEGQIDAGSGLEAFLDFLDNIFGFDLAKRPDIAQREKKLILERETARQKHDWPLSDQLRDQLASSGIELRDTDHGPIWNRPAVG